MAMLGAIIGTVKQHVKRLHHLGSRKPRRVLVVDDEYYMREYLKNVLTEAGYTATIADDGADALRKLEQHGPFDVLVTDLMMPVMNGDELARRVRRVEPTIRVLYVTGYSDQLFASRRTPWKDEAFLEKPCSPTGLIEAVSVLMTARFPQKTVWA
jgi:two-component system, cell cycle sensor histidine kinase and response regulator CckA